MELQRIGNEYVGEVNGYRFGISSLKAGYFSMYQVMFTFAHTVSRNQLQIVRSMIKKKNMMFAKFQSPNDSMALTYPKKMTFEDNPQFQSDMDDLTRAFKAASLVQDERCSLCRQDTAEPLQTKLWGVFAVKVHPSCVGSHHDHVMDEYAQEGQRYVRLPLSLFLGLLGGFVGILPMTIILMISGSYYSILFALIPIGAYFGYKFGNAPMRKVMIYSVIGITIFVVVCTQLVLWSYYALFAETTLWEVLAYSDGRALFFNDLLISMLFSGLGLFLSWRVFSKTSEQRVNDIEKMK